MIQFLRRLPRIAALAVWRLREVGNPLVRLADAARRRRRLVSAAPDRGLATVEVAILAAVLLGLATALLVAITAVVNRHVSQIK